MATYRAVCIDDTGGFCLIKNKVYTISEWEIDNRVDVQGLGGWYYASRFRKLSLDEELSSASLVTVASKSVAETLETALILKFGNHFLLSKQQDDSYLLFIKENGVEDKSPRSFAEGFLAALP